MAAKEVKETKPENKLGPNENKESVLNIIKVDNKIIGKDTYYKDDDNIGINKVRKKNQSFNYACLIIWNFIFNNK